MIYLKRTLKSVLFLNKIAVINFVMVKKNLTGEGCA